jgi:hypothetical protein
MDAVKEVTISGMRVGECVWMPWRMLSVAWKMRSCSSWGVRVRVGMVGTGGVF